MTIRSGRICLLVVLGLLAIAESSQAQSSVIGYAFAGPFLNTLGDRPFAWNVGAGGEAMAGNGVSFRAEIGQLRFPALQPYAMTDRVYSQGAPPIETSVISINASRHFLDRDDDEKTVPFVTGGVSLFAGGSEAVAAFNVAGGVDRWVTHHAGFRVELRGEFLPVPDGLIGLGVRVGLVLR